MQYVWGIYVDEIIQQNLLVSLNGFSAGALYPLQDLLYRTTGLADAGGTVREAYDTDAYGNTLIFRNGGDPPAAISFSSDTAVDYPTCPFIFTGQRFDPETGLYFYRARYYHAALGRFISRDPISYRGGFNLYEYVFDSPQNRVDPLGHGEKPAPMPPGPGPGWPKPEDIPGNIEDDNKDECIFECKGSPPPASTPGGAYCQGIAGPDDLLKQCQNLKKKCSRITVGGHGVYGGIGVSCTGKKGSWVGECFGCDDKGTPSKCFEQILGCFKGLLAPGGYLRICSCKTSAISDANTGCIRKMKAALGGAKVCFCKGEAVSQKGKYCHCDGKWVCM
jgi:RHS repeat-associated protein